MITAQSDYSSTTANSEEAVGRAALSSSPETEKVSGGVTEEDVTSSDAGDSSKEDADEQSPAAAGDRLEPSAQETTTTTTAMTPIHGPASADALPRPNLSTSSSSSKRGTRPGSRILSYESIAIETNNTNTTTTNNNTRTRTTTGAGKSKRRTGSSSMRGYAASASSSSTGGGMGGGNSSSSNTSTTASTLPNVITTTAGGGGVSSQQQQQQPQRSFSGAASTTSNNSKKGSGLRRGKWTVEEEAYVARVIQDFNSGFLDAPAGTTLRTYLSEKLQCDPMRITKKFTGDACIGKRVFHPAVRGPSNAAAIDQAQSELDGLERRWRRRLELQQRESAKKAAASAAAAAAAASGGRAPTIGNHPLPTVNVVPSSGGGSGSHAVTHTASWLDRAKTLLQEPSPDSSLSRQSDDSNHLPKHEIMNQIQEVEQLIQQGPQAIADTAGLLMAANRSDGTASPPSEPADKRPRTNTLATVTSAGSYPSSSAAAATPDGAEGAEALVGFLRSVRESAANQKF